MKKILVVIIGLLFVGIGIFILVNGNEKNKRCTEETVGTVVEIKEEKSRDDDGGYKYTYYPIIRYQAGDRTITKQSSTSKSSSSSFSIGGIGFSSSNSTYNVNDSIEILYNPNNVEEFIIKGDKSYNFIGIVFIFLGGLASILGIIKPVY